MFKFTLKLLRTERKKAFAIIIAIAISVMFIFSIIQLGDTFIYQYTLYETLGNHQDITIRGLNEEMANKIVQEINKDREDVPFQYSIMQKAGIFSPENKVEKSAVLFIGSEKDIQNMHDIKIREGTFPSEAYEIAISKEFNNQLKNPLKLGDKIQLFAQDNDQIDSNIEWKLTGFTIGERYLYAESEEKSQIWTSNTTIDELQKKGVTFDGNIVLEIMEFRNKMNIYLDTEDFTIDPLMNVMEKAYEVIDPVLYSKMKGTEETTEKEREEFKKVYERVQFNDSKESILTKASRDGEFGSQIKIPSIFIVLSTSVMIFCVMHLSIIEHIRRYGMLRCIGLSKRQLMRMLAYEYAGYGVLGVVLGLCVGILFNQFIGQTILSLLVIDGDMLIIQSVSSYIVTICLTGLSILIAFISIYIKLRKLSPNDMRKFEEVTKINKNKHKIEMTTKGQMISHFVKHNILRNITKSITITFAIAITIFFILTLINIFTTFEAPEEEMKSQFASIEIVANNINDKTDLTDKEIAQIADVADVEEVFKINQGLRNTIQNEKGEYIDYVVYSDNLINKFIELNQDTIEKNIIGSDNIILVNPISSNGKSSALRGIKENTDMEVVKMKTLDLDEEKTKVNIKIDSVVNGNVIPINSSSQKDAQPILILRENKAKELFGGSEFTHLLVSTKGAVKDEQQQAFTAILKNHEYVRQNLLGKNEKAAGYEQLIGLLFIAGYVGIITCMSGIISMINTMKANFKSHAKEYAVMRAIGMSQKTLCAISAFEMLILTFLAFIMATLLSIPLQIYVSQIQVDDVVFKPWIYVIVFVCSMIFVGVLSYSIARKATKFTIRESLQEDS